MSFTSQSKKSGASTFNLIILVVFLIGLVGRVSAHGILLAPPIRLVEDGDKILQAVNPTNSTPCGPAGDSPGPVTMYMTGEQALMAYNVTIPHPGPCAIQMSMHGDKDFKTIQELGECGKTTGLKTFFVQMPHEECGKGCTLRIMWNDDLGNWYLNCANIQVMKPMMHKRDIPSIPRKRSFRRSSKF